MKLVLFEASHGISRMSGVLVRITIATIFIWAGSSKALDTQGFFWALLGYDLPVPDRLLQVVAISLPWLEVLCGTMLMLGWWSETVLPLTCALCTLFVLMLGQAMLRGLHPDCGCFGNVAPAWFHRPDIALLRAVLLLLGTCFARAREGNDGAV